MELNLNPQSTTALYIQIYQAIKALIFANKLRPGQKLPSRRQLAAQNHVSTATVLSAYEQLLTEGFIVSRPRSGYYVANIQLQFTETAPIIPALDLPEPTNQIDLVHSIPDKTLFPYAAWKQAHQLILDGQDNDILTNTTGTGHPRLRQAVANYLSATRGVTCSYDQVVIGPSSNSLIQDLLETINHNHIIAIEDPGYQGFNFLSQHGYTLKPIPIDDNGISMDSLNQSNASIIIVTPNHQFPTGSIMPISRRQALLQWATKMNDRYIIENDYDGEFKYEGQPIPGLTHLDNQHRTIHIGSFSRNLAPGIRISYMVLPHDLKYIVVDSFQKRNSSVNTLTQLALAQFIESGELVKHLNRSRTFYRKKRNHLIDVIQNQDKKAVILGESAGLSLLFKPSFPFNSQNLKQACQQRRIALTTLNDYTFNANSAMEQFIYFSFSSIPFEVIRPTINQIYSYIKSET